MEKVGHQNGGLFTDLWLLHLLITHVTYLKSITEMKTKRTTVRIILNGVRMIITTIMEHERKGLLNQTNVARQHQKVFTQSIETGI